MLVSMDRMPVTQKSFWKNICSRENNGSITRFQLPYHGAAEQPAQPRTPPGPARCDQSREEMPGIPVRRAGCRAGVCWRIGARGGCGSGAITFDPRRFTRIQKHRYNRKTLLHRCIYFLGSFEVVFKITCRPYCELSQLCQ